VDRTSLAAEAGSDTRAELERRCDRKPALAGRSIPLGAAFVGDATVAQLAAGQVGKGEHVLWKTPLTHLGLSGYA
jgi:hypothetical protein